MKVIRDPLQLREITDSLLKELLERHFANLAEIGPYNPDLFGFFVLVEDGDSLEDVETVSGCSLRESWYEDCQFGDDDFIPRWEWLEYHVGAAGSPGCFEIVFVLDDSGFGVVILVPDQLGVDSILLKLCRESVLPGFDGSVPKAV